MFVLDSQAYASSTTTASKTELNDGVLNDPRNPIIKHESMAGYYKDIL